MAMEEFEKKDFSKILKHNALEGRRWMNSTSSDAVRVYDRNLPSFPITVDLYGPYARAVDYSDGGMPEDDRTVAIDLISRFLYVERDKVIWKERKKREGREQHEKEDESLRIAVHENGLEFECELRSYTDTGLFLDQALTRSYIESISMGMKVLNLFSYTGSFSVYAARGGADSVVSVDLSNVYTAWAEKNLENNGFLDKSRYKCIAKDASQYLDEAFENGERFDLVIFDPPAFSNSHKAEDFDVRKDYLDYLYRISRILTAGGAVLFSENIKDFRFEKERLKPFWKIAEITGDVHALGFSSKRSGLRVWMLRKVADMKELRTSAYRKEKMDDEKAERLSFEETAAPEEEKETKTEYRERREERRPERRRDGRRDDRRSGYRRNDRDFRGRDRDRGYSRDDRGERRYGDRDRYDDDYRSRRSDDRPRFDRDRRYDERPRRFDDRDRDRRYDDRPRYDRERRPYGDKESYRQRDNWPGRRNRDDYSSSPRRERDWDNDTGRFYRDSRDDRRGYREPRYSESGEDRRPFGDRRRQRNAPKPYGYDSFMVTKNRDKADVYWLKNTEVQSDDEKKD